MADPNRIVARFQLVAGDNPAAHVGQQGFLVDRTSNRDFGIGRIGTDGQRRFLTSGFPDPISANSFDPNGSDSVIEVLPQISAVLDSEKVIKKATVDGNKATRLASRNFRNQLF